MKISRYISLALLAVGIMTSCESDLNRFIIDESAFVEPIMTDPSIANPTIADPIVVTNEGYKGTVFTLNSTRGAFGVNSVIKHYAMISLNGEESRVGGTVKVQPDNTLEITVTYEELNLAMVNLSEVVPEEPINPDDPTEEVIYKDYDVELYVSAYLSDTYTPLRSEKFAINVTPIEPNFSIYDYIVIPGIHQSWNQTGYPRLYPIDRDGNETTDGMYYGFAGMFVPEGVALEFKVTTNGTWDGWGGSIDKLEGEANITDLKPGHYWMEFSAVDVAIKHTEIKVVGIIGDAIGGWGATNDIEMVMIEQNVWGAVANFTADKPFKIRMNNKWEIDLGSVSASDGEVSPNATPVELKFGGKNFNSPYTGECTLKLDLKEPPYTLTLEEGDTLPVAGGEGDGDE